MRMDRRAGARHMRRVDIVTDHLEREIGLYRRRDIEIPGVEQRPAIVLGGLDAAQITADLGFEFGVDWLTEIVAQQHIFGRDGAIGFEFEHPVPVVALDVAQRGGGARRGGVGSSDQIGSSFGQGRHCNAAQFLNQSQPVRVEQS